MYHRITLCMFLICALEFGQTDELPGPGTLRSLKKPVNSSSQYNDARFIVSHAVDGNTRRDSALCNCCAATKQENDPWIQIDLGRQYRVAIVEVVGRDDYDDPFNMDIFVSTTNTNWRNNPSTQPTLPDIPGQYHNVTFSYPVIGQFVTLQLRSYGLLCVCEVNIYSKDCSPGTYGLHCNETCGQCQNVETCDHVTGRWCDSGFRGDHCKEGIIRLSAAPGMQVSMSSVHAGMDATKAIDGQLVDDPETCGCCSETTIEYSSWWQVDLGRPFFLKKVIVYGRLNENIFRQLMGFSILTSLTYEFPDKPVHIQNGEIQDSKVVVLLPDVAARYVRIQRLGILTICEVELVQSDIICPTNTYGRSCTSCGPCKNASCDKVTGVCPSGCYDGYEGNTCEKLTVHKCTDNDFIIGVIGAGVGVVTSLLVVGLIVALFLYKKRRIRIYDEPSVRWSKEPTKESAYATLENQEIVIKKEETYDNPM